MANKPLVSPQQVRQWISYDPESGLLYWRERSPDSFPHSETKTKESRAKRWNTMYAGRLALNADDGQGYRVGKISGRCVTAHRVAWAIYYGKWPTIIDHINRNRSDNRISNLREVTAVENARNTKVYETNKTGFAGTSYCTTRGKYNASIKVHGVHKNLGQYETLQEAVAVRRAAEMKYGFNVEP